VGETVQFKCKCGYISKEIDEGIGFLEYELNPNKEEIYIDSALCLNCSEVIDINSDDRHPKCNVFNGSRVILYRDSRLSKTTLKTIQCKKRILKKEIKLVEVEDIFDDSLYTFEYCNEDVGDKTYFYCPKCKKFLMEQIHVAWWD
jgi:hypothetical protein